jgi:hypothetical protein
MGTNWGYMISHVTCTSCPPIQYAGVGRKSPTRALTDGALGPGVGRRAPTRAMTNGDIRLGSVRAHRLRPYTRGSSDAEDPGNGRYCPRTRGRVEGVHHSQPLTTPDPAADTHQLTPREQVTFDRWRRLSLLLYQCGGHPTTDPRSQGAVCHCCGGRSIGGCPPRQ